MRATTAATPSALDPGLVLRATTARDRDLLLEVYASTREDELALVGWPPAQKRAFVEAQFAAQDSYYREYYPGASFDLVLVAGRPAGRLYVDRWAEEIRIVDVALLPEHRERGIGSRLLASLMEEGAACGKGLTIHVETFSRARSLYERLGFVPVEDRGIYVLMKWEPGEAPERGDMTPPAQVE